MSRRSVLLFASALVTAATLAAQQPQPLSVVALFRVKPAKSSEWIAGIKKVYIPVLEKLMADGTVLAYGLDADILHRAGEPNMTAWYTVAGYAGLEKVDKAFEASAEKNSAVLQAMADAGDPDKHQDLLVRSVVSNHRPAAKGVLPYTRVSAFKVKPGKGEDFRKGFEKYAKPVYDKLLADGVVNAYSLDMEDQHSDDPAYRWFVVSMPELAAEDKIRAAFEAEEKKLSEEERKKQQQEFMDMMDLSAHRDYLMRAIVFAAK